eukprot:6462915-Amphidinium_carterae.1
MLRISQQQHTLPPQQPAQAHLWGRRYDAWRSLIWCSCKKSSLQSEPRCAPCSRAIEVTACVAFCCLYCGIFMHIGSDRSSETKTKRADSVTLVGEKLGPSDCVRSPSI